MLSICRNLQKLSHPLVPSSQMSLSWCILRRGRSWELLPGDCGHHTELGDTGKSCLGEESLCKGECGGMRRKGPATSLELMASREDLSQPFSARDAKDAHRELPQGKAQQQQPCSHLLLTSPSAASSAPPGGKRGQEGLGGKGGATTGTSKDMHSGRADGEHTGGNLSVSFAF